MNAILHLPAHHGVDGKPTGKHRDSEQAMTTQGEDVADKPARVQDNRVTQVFQVISYLQYPFMLIALVYTVVPFFSGLDQFWSWVNQGLIFAGLGISFSTLQDTRKTQNELSRKVWQDPKKAKRMLLVMSLTALVLLCAGLYGFLIAKEGIVKEVAFGTLMLGISYIGLIKAAIEMHVAANARMRADQCLHAAARARGFLLVAEHGIRSLLELLDPATARLVRSGPDRNGC